MARPAEQFVCSDCGATFPFSATEAQFYASRGLAPPKRCPSCRAARKARAPRADKDDAGRIQPDEPRAGPRGSERDRSAARGRTGTRPAASGAPRASGREGGWSPPRYTGDVNEYRSPMQVPQRESEYRAPAFRDPERTTKQRANRGGAPASRGAARVGFQVVCSACGAQAEVPFEPEAGREVFCQSCHRARRTAAK